MSSQMSRLAADAKAGFDPNHSSFRTCCCHVQTFTFVWGIIELTCLAISTLTIIVVLSQWSKLMEVASILDETTTTQSTTLDPKSVSGIPIDATTPQNEEPVLSNEDLVHATLLTSLVTAIIMIAVTGTLLYGVKTQRWALLIPHLVAQVIGVIMSVIGASIAIYYTAQYTIHPVHADTYSGTVACFILTIFVNCFVLNGVGRCAVFLKACHAARGSSESPVFSGTVVSPKPILFSSKDDQWGLEPRSPSPTQENPGQQKQMYP